MAWGIGRKDLSSQSEASTGPSLPQSNDHRDRVLTDEELLHRHGLSAAELEDLEEQENCSENTVGNPTQRSDHVRAREPVDIAALRRARLVAEYDGGYVRRRLRKQYKPHRDFDVEKVSEFASASGRDQGHEGKRPFLTPVGKKYYKDDFIDCYLDPKSGHPRRLVVQAVEMVIASASSDKSPWSWKRGQMRGSVPVAVRIAHWASHASLSTIESVLRQIIVALPLQILLGFPGARPPWENDFDPSYEPYPCFHWKWPKHSVNALDARQGDRRRYEKPQQLSTSQKLDRPRRLIVFNGEEWVLDEKPHSDLQYIFISYAWNSFKPDPDNKVSIMAQHACNEEGVRAYFQDSRCNASTDEGDLLTADVNRMCDIIRGAKFVALLLPDDDPQNKLIWGRRMWTLPEGLLTPRHLRVCTWRPDSAPEIVRMGKVELTSEFWTEIDGQNSARTLAEHYENVVHLSRLELFQVAISAFRIRETGSNHTGADLGYALMGLLRFRIDPDPTDDLFHVIARLSLANDNDRLIERLISMFPRDLELRDDDDGKDILRCFAEKDRYETYCSDIEAKCRVVGVADESGSVILSDCRAVPIHWNYFPQVVFKRKQRYKHRLAELVVRSGVWWLAIACLLAIAYAALFVASAQVIDEINDVIDDIPPVETEEISDDYREPLWGAIVFFAGMSAVLSFFAPAIVRSLFGGPMLQTAPYLVGFEGTMPQKELEKKIFGSYIGSLKYDPSSVHSGGRSRYLRTGKEPGWIARSEPHEPSPGHRWFTLVDTGNLTITVFEARRPPTVALITGADGGMLRAVLCSWRFVNDCHYRETVIRVPSNSWTLCKPAAWIKVCLNSQGDLLAPSNRPRDRLAGAKWQKASSAEPQAPPVPPKSSHRPNEPIVQEAHGFGLLERRMVLQSNAP